MNDDKLWVVAGLIKHNYVYTIMYTLKSIYMKNYDFIYIYIITYTLQCTL